MGGHWIGSGWPTRPGPQAQVGSSHCPFLSPEKPPPISAISSPEMTISPPSAGPRAPGERAGLFSNSTPLQMTPLIIFLLPSSLLPSPSQSSSVHSCIPSFLPSFTSISSLSSGAEPHSGPPASSPPPRRR